MKDLDLQIASLCAESLWDRKLNSFNEVKEKVFVETYKEMLAQNKLTPSGSLEEFKTELLEVIDLAIKKMTYGFLNLNDFQTKCDKPKF